MVVPRVVFGIVFSVSVSDGMPRDVEPRSDAHAQKPCSVVKGSPDAFSRRDLSPDKFLVFATRRYLNQRCHEISRYGTSTPSGSERGISEMRSRCARHSSSYETAILRGVFACALSRSKEASHVYMCLCSVELKTIQETI